LTLWRGDLANAAYTGQYKQRKMNAFNALSLNPSNDPSVRATEDTSCLGPRSQWDWQITECLESSGRF
jgi:hypothetical protein